MLWQPCRLPNLFARLSRVKRIKRQRPEQRSKSRLLTRPYTATRTVAAWATEREREWYICKHIYIQINKERERERERERESERERETETETERE
jgi:hypothetical protein